MSKQKSDFVSALGTSLEIFKALAEQIRELGGNDDAIRQILRDSKICKQVAASLVVSGFPSYQIALSTLTIEELVEAGNYENHDRNSINSSILSAEADRASEIKLASFGASVTLGRVLAGLSALDLRPATMVELLDLGAQHANFGDFGHRQRFSIVALDSAWGDSSDSSLVGCIAKNDAYGRGLYLMNADSGPLNYCHFAAVCK